MALLNYYNEGNRVVDQGLVVQYSVNKRSESETVQRAGTPDAQGNIKPVYATYNYFWSVVYRYAEKNYRYVGMDYETAKQCANDKIRFYTRGAKQQTTRHVEKWNLNEENITQTMCQARVSVQHVDGCMYEVVIQVNETDSVVVLGSYSGAGDDDSGSDEDGETNKHVNWNLPTNLASLFNYIHCDYEEGFVENAGGGGGSWAIYADTKIDPQWQTRNLTIQEEFINGLYHYTLYLNGRYQDAATTSSRQTRLMLRYGDEEAVKPYIATAVYEV